MKLKFTLFLFCFFVGCGNYGTVTKKAREDFINGHYADAAKSLEKGAHEEGVNQLLYLLDRATALHHAEAFEESIKDFQLADKLSEVNDYTSVSTEAATFLTSERIKHYKGEDFEHVLISQYLALNYLFLGKYEDALVECRRVNHKLNRMISEGKRKYKLNPMARYLSAIIYEAQGEWNDAYIDYKAVRELLPDFPYLREDLYRTAYKSRIHDEMSHWASEYALSAEEQKYIRESADYPEMIVIASVGIGPEKHPHPAWHAIPQFVPRTYFIRYGAVLVSGEGFSKVGTTSTLFNIEETAIENLDEKYGGILAKKLAGLIVKEVVADQVGRNTDPLLGAALRIGFYAADQADLRSWLTLPRDFQIFRVKVLPNENFTVRLTPRLEDGNELSSVIEKKVQFEGRYAVGTKSRVAFMNVRI